MLPCSICLPVSLGVCLLVIPMTEKPGQNGNQEISDELRQQVADVKAALADAKKKVEEVQQYYQKFQETKAKLEDNNIGLDAIFNFSQGKKSELDKLSATASEQLSSITQALERVRQHTEEVDTAYAAFKDSHNKVIDPNNGLEPVLTQAKQLRDEIGRLKESAAQILQQIGEQLTKVQESTAKMEEAYRGFEATRERINHPDEGLEAILQAAGDLKEKIQAAQKSASNTAVEIQALHRNAEEKFKAITDTRGQVEEIKKESESLKDSIAETLELVTDSSLDNAFKKRSSDLHSETKDWRKYLFLSIALLTVGLGGIYYLQSQAPNGFHDWKHWYRYLFASPLLYAVFFCTRQYTLSRSYAEKYAFKSVVATTLASYIKLLYDRFPDRKQEILDFTLRTTDLVYERPFTEKDMKRKVHLSLFNIFRGKIELDEKSIEKVTEKVSSKAEESKPAAEESTISS